MRTRTLGKDWQLYCMSQSPRKKLITLVCEGQCPQNMMTHLFCEGHNPRKCSSDCNQWWPKSYEVVSYYNLWGPQPCVYLYHVTFVRLFVVALPWGLWLYIICEYFEPRYGSLIFYKLETLTKTLALGMVSNHQYT